MLFRSDTMALFAFFLALACVSTIRSEDDYFEESGADCSSFRGTYNTLLEQTAGSLSFNSYGYFDAANGVDSDEQIISYVTPEIPARVAILEDCSFIINLNYGALWNSLPHFSTFDSSITGNHYLCGVATQKEVEGSSVVTQMYGPDFMVETPDVYNNYLDGTFCTIGDRKNIFCSIQLFGTMNFRAHLTLRNHGIDDDIDVDATGVSFLSLCATTPDTIE